MFGAALYAQDSFFTLSVPAAGGLLAIAGGLAIGAILVVWRIGNRRSRAVAIASAVLVFLGFEWLSPQIFYSYYRVLHPDLPAQVLLLRLPDPTTLAQTITFRGPANLSFHARGLLFWILMAVALVANIRHRRGAAN